MSAAKRSPGKEEQPDVPLPAIDLATFILSLSHSARVHFGELPDPSGEGSNPNLALAKQSIDLLALLRDKTRGNLTPAEERLLETTLEELSQRFNELWNA